ncbi:MAG: spore germination protein [Clostridia bacterium]|nr:spore germination protein [Clostridia bacterium]
MRVLGKNYRENIERLDRELFVEENFDVLKKTLTVGNGEVTVYFVDGFVKDAVMQKLMMNLSSVKQMPKTAEELMRTAVPYVETDVVRDLDLMISSVLSGASLLIGDGFDDEGILIDSRTYPARETAEPEGDRVMRGARDGFVETLIFNTALIRRRVRNPMLRMHYVSVGTDSRTDVVLSYLSDRADLKYVEWLKKKLEGVRTDALGMGSRSLIECLIGKRWYNPFPKVRTTERPDAAAAQLLEGSVLIIVDNSPQVMVLPSTIFDFMQETNDFYFPPLTGTYIRWIRYSVFFLTWILTPVWYLMIQYPTYVPDWLTFAMPDEMGKLPIFVQLLLVEFIIDALRLASLNTPNMLNNSLSVVGGLILGDFAVDIGWLIPEVILYMAFVAIANFTQRSYELGYAIKFLRMGILTLTAIFGVWGFLGGVLASVLLIATNTTLNGKRNYLDPLIPFRPRALWSLLVRVKKK